MEELASMQKAVAKCLRFTPEDIYSERSNFQNANKAYGDLEVIFIELDKEGLTFTLNIQDVRHKQHTLKTFSERSTSLGVLDV
jgi:hypothetical protein